MTVSIVRPPRKRRDYTSTGEVGKHLAAAGDLISRIKELEAELEPHREWILNHLNARDLSLISQGYIQAQRKIRHKWTYSAEAERDALALRTRQQWEQSQGIAQDNPTTYIAITFAKEVKS